MALHSSGFVLSRQKIKKAMAAIPAAALGSRASADEALKEVVPERGVRQFLLQNLIPDEQRWCLAVEALRVHLSK